MKLSQDIRSSLDTDCVYGLQGDTVTVICYHGSVAIVEDLSGKRFPVNAELLVLNADAKIEFNQPEKANHVKSKKSVQKQIKSKPIELF